jgi:Protein of unknown function (DUF4242)
MNTMPYFLIEVPMSEPGPLELERATRTLHAAQARLLRSRTATHLVITGITADDGRLVCLIEAPDLEAVRHLVTLALLPAARIRQVTHLTRGPGADRPAA